MKYFAAIAYCMWTLAV